MMLRTLCGLSLSVFGPIFLGTLLAAPYHPFAGLAGGFAAGSVVGISLFTVFAFLAALHFNLTWPAIVCGFFALLGLTVFCRKFLKPHDARAVYLPPLEAFRWLLLLGFGALVVVIVLIFQKVVVLRPDGLYVGLQHNFSYLPLDLHIITSFLYADNFPPLTPVYSNTPLRYGFLPDFYSAVVWFVTGNMRTALIFPGLVFTLSLTVFIFQWTRHLLGSKRAGLASTAMFFFNGGLGWINWPDDLWRHFHPTPDKTFDWLPQFYTTNVLHAILPTHRGFQLALPLALLFLAAMLPLMKRHEAKAGVVWTMVVTALPFFDLSTTVALWIAMVVLAVAERSSLWLLFCAALAGLWGVQALYFNQMLGPHVDSSTPYFALHWGYEAGSGWHFLKFWLMATGVFLPLATAGWRGASTELRAYGLAGAAVFAAGNMFRFQPFLRENILLFILAYLLTVPLAVRGLQVLWYSRWQSRVARMAAGVLFVSLTLSGSLDILHALRSRGENFRILQSREMAVAEWVRENIPPHAVFLAGPTWDQPLLLSGRAILLGSQDQIDLLGFSYRRRKGEIVLMGSNDTGAAGLFKMHGVTHVIYGPREHGEAFNREFFAHSFEYLGGRYSHLFYKLPSS